MKMNKPYIEIVRFDAEDVIATSGVLKCAVNPLHQGDILLHRNNQGKNYFVYDYDHNTSTDVTLDGQTTLRYGEETTTNTLETAYKGSSESGISAYIFEGGNWKWWDGDTGSHGNY